MGTNYYECSSPCITCGHVYRRHIGKSSAGWCFSLHVYPEDGINDLDDWKARWAKVIAIEDEYGHNHSAENMISAITERRWDRKGDHPYGYQSWAEFHRDNESCPGPNGLVRHALNNRCIKHGEGTWDCIIGHEDGW